MSYEFQEGKISHVEDKLYLTPPESLGRPVTMIRTYMCQNTTGILEYKWEQATTNH